MTWQVGCQQLQVRASVGSHSLSTTNTLGSHDLLVTDTMGYGTYPLRRFPGAELPNAE